MPKGNKLVADIIATCTENQLVKRSNDQNANIIKVVLHERGQNSNGQKVQWTKVTSQLEQFFDKRAQKT